ncbi:asparagine synthase (glutamine-hydrolyzing) [Dyella solisilvae]|uniref:asparagine synthase (glutamine-hydrolyzing) n=1 Tax=Dyella solisilvae TaxID=1920168 RepID=A0A370K4K6_9GAMM|nr:asparagine synthase (glutamine-hydrolyzing) [Dyella solisilvae]RDI97558.1 asparagine synthase (glutamine-hydrolyzing) [Dyella solisilvae]
MCGISGVMLQSRTQPRDEAMRQVHTMLSAMSHRGPDGQAEYASHGIVLGANRLAIRGTDERQPPLFAHEAGIVVVCNGEIDNHRELRRWLASCGHVIEESSDIAVLAPLYLEKGLAFLDDLEGVYAIALWDARKQQLILARDRAGERHLYYSVSEQGVTFASELAAMVAGAPDQIDLDSHSLPNYLRSGYCPSQWTLLARHFKVCPGEAIVFEGQSTRHVRYWQPPMGRAEQATPDAEEFDRRFRNAIARQTDIDVDFGVLLSGGLDSSLITAVTRSVRPKQPLNAYCIRFGESSFDEGCQAEAIARQFACQFTPVTVVPSDIPVTLKQLIATTGEPLADPAWLPLSIVTKRAAQDVKVLLAGEGADELFGGYPTYLGARLATHYAHLPKAVRAALRRLINSLPVSDQKVTVSFLLKRFVEGQSLDGLARHLRWTANLSAEWIEQLGFDYPADCTTHDAARLIDVIQSYDFSHSLPDALLAKADRGGMCHAVEIRAPFLDRAVIDFAATLPLNERVRRLTTKVFLKNYARRYLSASTIHRRKRGLSVPLGQWLRGPLLKWAEEKLSSHALADAGVDNGAALALLSEHVRKSRDHARGLWNLIVLAEWLEWLRDARGIVSAESVKCPSDILVDV